MDRRGGAGDVLGHHGEEGTITGIQCPKGLYGIFCSEPLFPVESHFWHGSTYAQLITLPVTGGYDYPQFGTPPEGLKYGILYADGDDSLSRQFLAAVHVPLPVNVDANNFKVYVEAGPIGPVDWNVVEVKLNMATSNKAVYDNPICGGQVLHAEVSKERNGYTFISFRN